MSSAAGKKLSTT